MKIGQRLKITEGNNKKKDKQNRNIVKYAMVTHVYKDKIIVSYGEYSECFNLAAFIDPTTIKIERKVNGIYQPIVVNEIFDLRIA